MSRTIVAGDDLGFTLLELLIVIAIAGVISTVAVLRFPDLSDRMLMERLGGEIEREILRLGRLARESGTDQLIRFDPAGRKLELSNGRSIAFDDDTSALWFGAAGNETSDGTLTFFGGGGASGGELLVTRGMHKVRIRVDWLSARPSRTST